MIDEACHHQKSNNRLEGDCNMQEIQASPTPVQTIYTVDAYELYHGGLPNVDLSREDIKISGVTQ
ncbi:hypothetical protein [Candidatus Poseidonia alphae]|uniref:hypothetical protein n=1 Tax=Candidatus Poseidonia alphae TaxID=1915863 RepID=UPI0030C76723